MDDNPSPLEKAAQDGDIETLDALLSSLLLQTGTQSVSELLYGPTCQAIKHDNVVAVQKLLQNYALDKDPFLKIAVRAGAFGVLKLLLTNYGCDINKPINKITPPVLR